MEQKLIKLKNYEKTLKFIIKYGKFPTWSIFAFFISAFLGKILYNQLYVPGIVGYFVFLIMLNIVVALSFGGIKKCYFLCCEKLDNIKRNICEIEKKYNLNSSGVSIADRFNLLSRDKQLKLLNFIKEDSIITEMLSGFRLLSEEEKILLQSQLESVLQHKKEILYSDLEDLV